MARCFTWLFVLLSAAGHGQEYFQQALSYDITVSLDDRVHELTGQLTLEYTNNSPDILQKIPFHVWPNAYESNSSAFAKQQLRLGSTEFYFAKQEERGALDGLNFTVDGTPAKHDPDEDHPDIVYLQLPKPIAPDRTITIRTPFRVDIPASFSRLGHVGESYQMTQWYPKPAVYDRGGWHAMPYLDQGEFYGEFGSFRVAITLPENYVVGATGTLEEERERKWLLDKAERDAGRIVELAVNRPAGEPDFPASAATEKTITYVAEGVHDFAWFADKRFYVQHDTLSPGGAAAPIDVWSFFTDTDGGYWKRSLEYLKRATRFYSEALGAYPYPQVTGVQSALSAGGGMEYPMITVIGRTNSARALDNVLTHEVGHNWFYGILGSNERTNPWMDEGLNSYYEQRYMATFYTEDATKLPLVGNPDLDRLGYRYLTRQGKDQAPNTRADSLSEYNYWVQAYSKPAMAMHDLEAYVGRARLDAAMQVYYDTWRFKHPRPEDFFQVLRASLGQSISPWFERAMLTTYTSDWRVGRVAGGRVDLAHSGTRLAPASSQIKNADGASFNRTIEVGEATVEVPEATSVALPYAGNRLDLYGHNNRSDRRRPALRFGISAENDERYAIHVFPLVGYNAHDGLQVGAALHNRTLAPRKLEWVLAPLYGFGGGEVNGFAGGRYRVARPFGRVRQALINGGVQRWSDFTFREERTYAYTRAGLRAEFQLDHPAITQRSSSLFLQAISLWRDRPAFDQTGELLGTESRNNYFLRLGYDTKIDREINPFGYEVVLEYKNRDASRPTAFESAYLRLDATFEGALQYLRKRHVRWRAYTAVFLKNELRESSFQPESTISLIGNAESDYRRDGLYFGRNLSPDQANWPDRQVEQRQGGFRIPLNNASPGGTSNSYLAAVNLDVDLPLDRLPIPLGVFLDAGVYGSKQVTSDPNVPTFNWVAGASLSTADNRVGIYLPLVADPDVREQLERRGNLLQRITFRLELEGWAPWKWIDDLL